MKNISYNEETTLIFEKGVGKMLFWKDEETGKTKKVTVKDLQDNIMKIRMTMNWVEEERAKTIEVMKLVDKNSETGIEKYKVLHGQLKELNEMFDSLQSQEEKQYAILKKYKDSKFYIQPKDWLMIGGTTVLAIFIIALDRESPKITKLASFILKLFPMHI